MDLNSFQDISSTYYQKVEEYQKSGGRRNIDDLLKSIGG